MGEAEDIFDREGMTSVVFYTLGLYTLREARELSWSDLEREHQRACLGQAKLPPMRDLVGLNSIGSCPLAHTKA